MSTVIRSAKGALSRIAQKVRKNITVLRKILPILSFIIPFLILYSLYPKTFEATWKGRTYYLFFLWLACLEIILDSEKLQTSKVDKLKSARTIAFCISLLLPTVYVIVANYYGLNATIGELIKQMNIPFIEWMLISIEYLVFTMFFTSTILLEYGIKGLKTFLLPTAFLGMIGVIYTIDNLYPYGRFTPFQILVPTTAKLATYVLGFMGYRTLIASNTSMNMPYVAVFDQNGNPHGFYIAWPCSGVESLLIYTLTILLFFEKTAIPWKHRIIYFIIGAIITYSINILRIVTIFIIAANNGDVWTFHDYYAQLYSVTWIMSYPLIIIGTRSLWSKIRNKDIKHLEGLASEDRKNEITKGDT